MARKPIIIGAVAIIALFLLAGGCFFANRQTPPQENNGGSIGVIDYEAAIDAHPKGAAYREKLAEYRSLSLTIERLEAEQGRLKAAGPGRAAFEDAARQKAMQEIIKLLIELDERLAEIEKAYREETGPEHQRQKKAVDEAYQNAIVNLQLKIKNADVMRLPEETVAELKRREEELKRERAEQSIAVTERYEAMVAAHMREVSAAERAKLGLKSHETREFIEAQELLKQGEAANRNLETLAKELALDLERQEKWLAAKQALAGAGRELKALEAEIGRDIKSQAARAAAQRKLEIVIRK